MQASLAVYSFLLVLLFGHTFAQAWFLEWLYKYVRGENFNNNSSSNNNNSTQAPPHRKPVSSLIPNPPIPTSPELTPVPTVPSSTARMKAEERQIPTTTASSSSSTSRRATIAPAIETATDCKMFDDAALYAKLQRVGAFNQRFMANTIREAARFPDLLPPQPIKTEFRETEPNPGPKPGPGSVNGNGNEQSTDGIQPRLLILQSADPLSTMPDDGCDTQCQALEHQLQRELLNWQNTKNRSSIDQSINKSIDENPVYPETKTLTTTLEPPINDADAPPATTEERSVNSVCKLDAFFNVGDCDKRGSGHSADQNKGFERLCTSCRGVYKVSVGCFPQFFNAVQCDGVDRKCIYDWWRTSAHGKCLEQRLTFTVMRNTGTDHCQHWEYTNLDVPIGCECFLSRSSWLRAA